MAPALDHQLLSRPYCGRTFAPHLWSTTVVQVRRGRMLLYEYKLRLARAQAAAIDEAIRPTPFIRNKPVRRRMDGQGFTANDLQLLRPRLAQQCPCAAPLNSQARQAAARAWA